MHYAIALKCLNGNNNSISYVLLNSLHHIEKQYLFHILRNSLPTILVNKEMEQQPHINYLMHGGTVKWYTDRERYNALYFVPNIGRVIIIFNDRYQESASGRVHNIKNNTHNPEELHHYHTKTHNIWLLHLKWLNLIRKFEWMHCRMLVINLILSMRWVVARIWLSVDALHGYFWYNWCNQVIALMFSISMFILILINRINISASI